MIKKTQICVQKTSFALFVGGQLVKYSDSTTLTMCPILLKSNITRSSVN